MHDCVTYLCLISNPASDYMYVHAGNTLQVFFSSLHAVCLIVERIDVCEHLCNFTIAPPPPPGPDDPS